MIMTAGHGTRLRPFTGMTSKPLLPIMSVPIIHLVADHLAAHGVRKCVCNLHAHSDETRKGIQEYQGQIDFNFSDESEELLGSWGGLVTAAQSIQGDCFFWINGDVLSNADLGKLSSKHQELKAKNPKLEITLLLSQSGKTEAQYREIMVDRKTGLVIKAGELGSNVLFYASSAVVDKKALSKFQPGVPLDFVKDYLVDAIQRGVVGFSEQPREIWLDIGSPELWAQAHFELIRALESGNIPAYWKSKLELVNQTISSGIWRIAELSVPEQIKYSGPVYLGSGDYDWDDTKSLGPNLVLYGLESSEIELKNRIVYSGMSVQFFK